MTISVRACTTCKVTKTLMKSSWYANDVCAACRAKDRYEKSNRHEYKKEWRQKNKEHCIRVNREYIKSKKQDPIFKIKKNLRNRLNQAIKNNQKSGSAIDDLSCSIDNLKTYLENKFQPGMSWDNYGEWHIDHIKALANFDLENREELLKACHYTNLQPLWAKDNFSKGKK